MERLNFLLKEERKRTRKIAHISIDGQDRVWLRIYGEDERFQFDPEKQEIVLGSKAVEPWLSYAINSWNVMLPFITYKCDKEKVERYLDSVRLDKTCDYEEEDI